MKFCFNAHSLFHFSLAVCVCSYWCKVFIFFTYNCCQEVQIIAKEKKYDTAIQKWRIRVHLGVSYQSGGEEIQSVDLKKRILRGKRASSIQGQQRDCRSFSLSLLQLLWGQLWVQCRLLIPEDTGHRKMFQCRRVYW